MFIFNNFNKLNYKLSNSIIKIDFTISDFSRNLTKLLLKTYSESERQKIGEQLLDELCDLAQIDIVNLKISSNKQRHKKQNGKIVMREYGFYRPKEKLIFITNRTAARGQILAPKTFVDTLLHEWMHHFDFLKLKINSIHSRGFYSRLKDLKTKLGYFDS